MRQLFNVPILVLTFLLLLITGCATPYQKMGFTGGYEDTHLKANTYYVNVQTNAYTSQITAVQYFHRRAKELCLENGYEDYRISNERDTSGAFGTYGGGAASVAQKPGFAGYVECLGKKK
jgi:hypothetical protein